MPGSRDDERSQQNEQNKGERGQQPANNEQDPRGQEGGLAGATSVNTSDPAVSSPEEMHGPPEQVVSFQTSQLPSPPPDYPFASGGDVVKEQSGRQKGDGEQKGEEGRNQGDQKGDQEQENDRERKEHGQGRNNKNGRGERQRDRNQDDERNGDQRRRRKKKKKHQQATRQPNWQTLLMTAVLALVCGVGGAWAYSAIFSSSDNRDKSSDKSDKGGGKSGGKSGGKADSDKGASKSGSASSEGGASASEIPGFNSAKDADTFKKELEHLAHRLDLLGARIDRMTTNEAQTPPVLRTVQRKVMDLEREVDQVANLPTKMDRLDRKVSDLKQEFRTLKEQVTGSELPIASELAPPRDYQAAPPLGESTADPADEATLKLAAGLVREGHYDQAYEVLRRLQRERPHDARVWYLSAVARGSSSGEWGGKTKKLAEQGIACEREGHPSREKIDAALTGLTDVGKNWLAEQRREMKVR